jgi:hypothetical protein
VKPQRDRRGKSQLLDARMPGDVDIPTRKGYVVVPGTVYGAWDVYADDEVRIVSTGRLLGRDRGDDDSSSASSDTRADRTPARLGSRDAEPLPDGEQARPNGRGDAVAAGRGEHAGAPQRRKLTKVEVRIRRQTQAALALRAEGWSVEDIAAHFGVTRPTLVGWFTSHRRHVTTEEIDSILDQTAIPLATENLIHGLLEGDKDYTLEVLKGRGALRRHGESDKAPSTGLPELRIVFEAPTTGPIPITAAGSISGVIAVPKQIEGHVVESHPLEPDHGNVVQVPRDSARVSREPESPESLGR